MSEQHDDDADRRPRPPDRAALAPGRPPGDRLLLRLSDRQPAVEYQREPRHRPAGDRGGDRPGLTVLLGVPRVRADVPTAHGAGDLQAGRDHSGRRGNRLRRCAVCVPRLPRPRQPRTRDRVHRPFPGVVDADPAARSRSRRQAGGPQTARLGAAHGRQRHGQARPGDRWRLLPHRGVSRRDADRMRRRLFKLRRDAAGEQSVRSCGDRDQPVRPPRDGPPDPVRQPGRAHRRPRGAAPLLPEQHDPRDAGPRPGAHPADDAVGVVPGRVHGTVSFGRRRDVARRRAGHHSRRPPPGRDAVPRPDTGACTASTSISRSGTSSRSSSGRPRRIRTGGVSAAGRETRPAARRCPA